MEDSLQVVIGVDGGATYSHGVAVAHNGEVCAVAHSGPLNFLGSTQKEVRRRLNEIIRELELQLPISNQFTHYTFGATGIFSEATVEEKERLCGRLFPWKQTRVVGDSVIAFYGATLGNHGVLTIGGTGSTALARNEDGKFFQVGGWGHVLGDAGSSHWIAVEAIKAAIAAREGTGPASLVGDVICERHEVKDLSGIVPIIYHPDFTKDRLASLAQYLDRQLREEDAVFGDICRRAGEALAQLTITAVEMAGLVMEPVPVFITGGVLNFNRMALAAFDEALRLRLNAVVSNPRLPAMLGAAILAMFQARIEVSSDMFRIMEESYQKVDRTLHPPKPLEKA